MIFGMPTLVEYSSLEENLTLCAELGLDFVELNMSLPEFQPDLINTGNAKRLLERFGKFLTIHLDENLNVCDFNPAVAGAYLSTVLRTISVAAELDIPVINMHLSEGVHFKLPGGRVYLYEKYRAWYLDRLARFRDACSAAADGSGALICVENCGKFHGFQQEGIDLLLESPCFALTYDIGHDFCADGGNEAFILNRADRLKHMHVHDAAGSRSHLTLGTGEIGLPEMLDLARRHGCRCVLEVKSSDALRHSAGYVKRYSDFD